VEWTLDSPGASTNLASLFIDFTDCHRVKDSFARARSHWRSTSRSVTRIAKRWRSPSPEARVTSAGSAYRRNLLAIARPTYRLSGRGAWQAVRRGTGVDSFYGCTPRAASGIISREPNRKQIAPWSVNPIDSAPTSVFGEPGSPIDSTADVIKPTHPIRLMNTTHHEIFPSFHAQYLWHVSIKAK
jgi:hypothetical protein